MKASCDEHSRNTRGCPGCQKRNAAYNRRRRAGLRDGSWERWLTGDQVREVQQHLRDLLALPGVTRRVIGRVAGVAPQSLSRILLKEGHSINPQTAQALLQTTAEMCLARHRAAQESRDWVNPTGAARRLQALAADGWDPSTLASLGGLSAWRIKHLRCKTSALVPRHIHEKIRELYEKIQSQADPSGGSAFTAAHARRHGYLPPECWADEDIDNPDAQPLPPPPDTEDHVAITRTIEDCLHNPQPGKAADLPKEVKQELARHANQRLGWSWERIAWLMGYKSPSSAHNLIKKRPDRIKEGETDGRRKQHGSKQETGTGRPAVHPLAGDSDRASLTVRDQREWSSDQPDGATA